MMERSLLTNLKVDNSCKQILFTVRKSYYYFSETNCFFEENYMFAAFEK